MLAAQRARIAALTAAALLALFVGQPLHGPAAASEFHGSTTSFASDAGVAPPGTHHAHLCPLCRAANQARFVLAAVPNAILTAFVVHHSIALATPIRPVHRLDLGVSGPRAPPTPLSPLV
jgi:hypothetical protein